MHGPLRPPDATASETAQRIFSAGAALLRHLETGRAIDARALRGAMTAAFGGTDAEGVWLWKQAYEAGEVATTLLLRRFGPAMIAQAASPAGVLALIARIARLEPPQTRRDDVQQRFQQFSTPLELAWCVAACAERDRPRRRARAVGRHRHARRRGRARPGLCRRRTPGAQRAHEHPARASCTWRSPAPA